MRFDGQRSLSSCFGCEYRQATSSFGRRRSSGPLLDFFRFDSMVLTCVRLTI